MKRNILALSLLLSACSLGHKEVKYSEMAAPPQILYKGDEILVKTQNSKEFPSFSIYEINPTVDEGEKIILLKAFEGRGREIKNEFKINLANMKDDSTAAYKFVWLDPDNSKTVIPIHKAE